MTRSSKGLLAGLDETAVLRKMNLPAFSPLRFRLTQLWEQAAEAETGRNTIAFRFACGSSYVTPGLKEAALEHRLTGDPRALAYVQGQIDKLAVIWSHPPESLNQHTGGRTTYFSDAEACLAGDLCYEALDPDRRDTLLRLVREHFIDDNGGDRSFYNYSAGHNIAFTRLLAAGICALVLGEESGHKDWRRVVDLTIDAARVYCRWSVDEAGVSYEATLYGMAVFGWLYLFAECLLRNGGENLFDTIPALKRIPDMCAGLLFPDRNGLASINDSRYQINPLPAPWLLLTAHRYNRPQDAALWLETQEAAGDQSTHPLETLLWWDGAPAAPLASFNLPTAFYGEGTATATFRTSWSRDALFLNVLGQGRSHGAMGHAHADAGHFTLAAYGEQLALDIGYWNLNEDQHNLVMIDGQGPADSKEGWFGLQPYAGRMKHFQRHELLDYVLVDAVGAKRCIWADRHALFVRLGDDDGYTVLIDNINVDNAKHSFWWQLHAPRESGIAITGSRTAEVRRPGARLDCAFFSPLPTDFPSDPHVLEVRADEKVSADPPSDRKVHPRLLAIQTGLNCQLVSVLVPRRAGAPALPVVDRSIRRTFRLEMDAGPFTDTLIIGLDHALLKFPDVQGLTELALIRRDRAGRLLDYWTVDDAPLCFSSNGMKGQ